MSRFKSRWLRPDYVFTCATGITPEFLSREGISGIILDLDNTLTRWEDANVAPGIAEWVQALKDAGIVLVILSNGVRNKQVSVSKSLDIPLITSIMPKPLAGGFRRALHLLELPCEKVAMVGDIIFTDILGANRLGIKTILTDPLSRIDFPGTKVWRLLEVVFRLRRPYRGDASQ